MDRYRVRAERIGSEPALAIYAPDDAAGVLLALRGATLLNWQVRARGERTELTDGYRDEAELLAQDGVRAGILAPFPNRIADGRYRFAGREYGLAPGAPQRITMHGFARTALFELADVVATHDSARLVLRTHAIRAGVYPGYPFSLDLEVSYTIRARRIDVEIAATNTGPTAAPYAAGWHPYFRLGLGIDDLTLQIPAGAAVLTDDAMIPLDGPGAYVPLDRVPALDFRQPRRLDGNVIDACFTGLRPGRDGRVTTILHDPATGDELRVWQTTGMMHVFTGDTLARDRRRSIALEPVEVPTNAFNRPEYAEAILIRPGRRRVFGFGVGYAPG